MLTRDALRDLVRHMEWADARMWNAVPLDATDLRLRVLLTHIHVVQYAFLTIWTEGDVNAVFQKEKAFTALDDVRNWARRYFPQVNTFVDEVSTERLAQPVQMPWAAQIAEYLGHEPGVTTVAETLFQVTSHSTYHRGQVNARLRDLGAEPPLVDYIAWLWSGRPAPEWKA